MRYDPIPPSLFRGNRERLCRLLKPHALAVLNANDVLPTSADGTFPLHPNSDLFYLSGIEQEETRLVLFPDCPDAKMREIVFLREPDEHSRVWDGQKHSRDEAAKLSGIASVRWLSEFPGIFRSLMAQCERVYLNSNEHPRASVPVETRDARFIASVKRDFPLHRRERLAPLLSRLRAVKSDAEIRLIRKACAITARGFRRVARKVKPGVRELDIEAEFAHEFIRNGAKFAYPPIVASGANSCVLHYIANDQVCRRGGVVLLDVGASHANYNGDMTRTLPVSGRFTPRQRSVYNAALRVLRQSAAAMRPGRKLKEVNDACMDAMEKELVDLKLLKSAELKNQDPDNRAARKFMMHGVSHPLGLDVHDVHPPDATIESGWVLTCEPGIYLPAEGFGIRLENDIVVGTTGNTDLMEDFPIEAAEIEALMAGMPRR